MNAGEKVKEILRKISRVEDIAEDDRLQDELSLDSLRMVVLLIEIEEAFGIELDESDMDPFALTTVGDVVGMVMKYCGGGDAHDAVGISD